MASLSSDAGYSAASYAFPVATAGFGLASDIYGANKNYDASLETNRSNEKIAKQNRHWQEVMSNTAHQREVADMTAAGINPIIVTGKQIGRAHV